MANLNLLDLSHGWCRVVVTNNTLTVFRGKKAIANHFMEVFHG